MDVYEALYTTRMMRRMRPDPIPMETQCRILDAAIRAPNGGNAQRWHFVAVDDPDIKAELAELYVKCRDQEYADFASGKLGTAIHDAEKHAATMRKISASEKYFVEHFTEIPSCCSSTRSTTTVGRTSSRPSGASCWPPGPRASAAS
jgi:nitroreductase